MTQIDINTHRQLEAVRDDLVATSFMLHYLMGDLEFSLNRGRGRVDDMGTVTLRFQQYGIDQTLWMAGEVWLRSKDNLDRLARVLEGLDVE